MKKSKNFCFSILFAVILFGCQTDGIITQQDQSNQIVPEWAVNANQLTSDQVELISQLKENYQVTFYSEDSIPDWYDEKSTSLKSGSKIDVAQVVAIINSLESNDNIRSLRTLSSPVARLKGTNVESNTGGDDDDDWWNDGGGNGGGDSGTGDYTGGGGSGTENPTYGIISNVWITSFTHSLGEPDGSEEITSELLSDFSYFYYASSKTLDRADRITTRLTHTSWTLPESYFLSFKDNLSAVWKVDDITLGWRVNGSIRLDLGILPTPLSIESVAVDRQGQHLLPL